MMNSLSTKIQSFFLFITLLILFACKSHEEMNIVYPEGGYPYLKTISSRDSNNYFLAARHLMPDKDSFLAFDSKYFFQGFNEENLSLYSPKDDIFRFTFECGFCGKAAIINLTKTKIVIKKNREGYAGITIDRNLLSPLEKEHFYLFERYYPFTDSKYPEKYKERYTLFFDSLIKIYPQLLDQEYFEKLRLKASIIHKMPVKYIEAKIPITNEKFKFFVTLLNNSGFWQRSYRNDCASAPMDGDGFIIEAATKRKYHFMNADYCQGDFHDNDIRKMLTELLSYIHFDLEAFYVEDFPKK